jgi:hypothetical protein
VRGFGVSARPGVPEDTLSIWISFHKLTRLTAYMDESFLLTESWNRVRKRIAVNQS